MRSVWINTLDGDATRVMQRVRVEKMGRDHENQRVI